MIIGVPKEAKTDEYRIGMIPAGVEILTRHGHKVRIQAGAGAGEHGHLGHRLHARHPAVQPLHQQQPAAGQEQPQGQGQHGQEVLAAVAEQVLRHVPAEEAQKAQGARSGQAPQGTPAPTSAPATGSAPAPAGGTR